VDSDPRSGRPSTSKTAENVERVRSAINKNRRLTVRELEEDFGISKNIVNRILTEDLEMYRVIAKFVPRVLTEDQKNSRVEIVEDNSWNPSTKILSCLEGLLLAMKHGFMATTLKQKHNLRNGRREKSLDLRKRVKVEQCEGNAHCFL